MLPPVWALTRLVTGPEIVSTRLVAAGLGQAATLVSGAGAPELSNKWVFFYAKRSTKQTIYAGIQKLVIETMQEEKLVTAKPVVDLR